MAIPAGTITEAFRRQYSDNFNQVYQQTESELESLIRKDTQQAEWKSWDFIGTTSGNWDRSRQAQTVHTALPHMRRWNKQKSWTWSPDLIDDLDVLEAMKSPQSDYIKSGVASSKRALDELILQRLGAAVTAGKDADKTINYYDVGECTVMASDGTFATAGSAEAAKGTGYTGLTLTKIANIGLKFDNLSIPQTDRHIVANADQKWSLLTSTQVTSSDYNTVKALVNGSLNSYLGFQFHWLPTERFVVNAVELASSAAYPCIDTWAFHRDSVLMTTGKTLDTRIDQLPDYNYAVQVWAEMMLGAIRLQGAGVAKIVLKTSPTPTFS
jgi:hypothetical protein